MSRYAVALLFTIAACGGSAPVGPGGPTGVTGSSVQTGWVADLVTRQHGVRGKVTVTSATTLHVTGFFYDNTALGDVRFYGGNNSANFKGFAFGPQLAGRVWANDSLDLTLPAGQTVADLDGISVWCVIAGVSLGDAQFRSP